MVIAWSIWKERNNRIFNNQKSSLSEIQDLILLRLVWWIKTWDDPFPHSPEEVRRNPACLLFSPRPVVCKPPAPISHWSAPVTHQLKWNVDASLNPSLGRSAIGVSCVMIWVISNVFSHVPFHQWR